MTPMSPPGRYYLNGLNYRVRVAGDGPALLLLHGFTGSGDVWAPFVSDLSGAWRVVAPDLPGHGDTDAPEDAERYRMERCVDDLALLLDSLHADQAVVLGYSMGGRVALHFATTFPERVRALVLESASPGIASEAERRARREQDETLARFVLEEGVEPFVDRWERLPLFRSQAHLPADVRARVRARRLSNRARGLAGSLQGMGAGVPRPLMDELPRLRMPTLLLAGQFDDKYCRILGEMGAIMPNATLKIVAGAGHAVHVERPDEWLQHVGDFLNTV